MRLLLANGAMDHGPWEIEQARVVGKFSMSGALPSRRLVVTSWRPGHRVERVPVNRRDLDLYYSRRRCDITIGTG